MTARIGEITWEKGPTREDRKTLTGAYVIETSETDLSASDIWSLTTTLTSVEKAFRSRAHLFISVLAYMSENMQTDTPLWRTGGIISSILSYSRLLCMEGLEGNGVS